MEIYTSNDVIKILPIKRERLRDWILKKFIVPSLPQKGQGQPFEFTRLEVYILALFHKMIERGLSRPAAMASIQMMVQTRDLTADTMPSSISIRFSESGPNLSWIPLERKSPSGKSIIDHFTDEAEHEEEWDDIVLINTRRLKEQVDKKIKELGR